MRSYCTVTTDAEPSVKLVSIEDVVPPVSSAQGETVQLPTDTRLTFPTLVQLARLAKGSLRSVVARARERPSRGPDAAAPL